MAGLRDSRVLAIVDDDDLVRGALCGLREETGFPARAFAWANEFLDSGRPDDTACLISEALPAACEPLNG
jgi:FixJ family two-component response regulator